MPGELKDDKLKIMVDIETLSLSHNPAIVQIAAAPWTFEAGIQENVFNAKIDISCYKKPEFKDFDCDLDTVKWWMQQDKSAQVFSGERNIKEALQEFSDYLSQFDKKETRIWCQGASFDFPKLNYAFKVFDLPTPWLFYRERCSRTFLELAPNIGYRPKTTHDALQDVRDQIKNCCEAWSLMPKGQTSR